MIEKKLKKFAEGIIAKRGSDKADWVLCKLSVKREEAIAWLQGLEGDWVNLEVSKSEKAKYGASIYIDEYKPDANYQKPVSATVVPDMPNYNIPDVDYGDDIDPNDIPF